MDRPPILPSLFVPDIAKAVAFYQDELGFERTGAYGDDGEDIWAELRHGEACVWMFSQPIEDRPQPAFSGLIYVFVDDADAKRAALGPNTSVRWGPETQDYGYREVGVEDLNGYLLVFAQDLEH
ncbi:MAG: VOC family protein [Pseudomonadota bacterium]